MIFGEWGELPGLKYEADGQDPEKSEFLMVNVLSHEFFKEFNVTWLGFFIGVVLFLPD